MPTKKALKVVTIDTNEKLLRTPSQEVSPTELKSKEFQDFLDTLLYTVQNLRANEGWEAAGLSAVQAGVPKAVFYARDRDRNFKEYINPKVKPIGKTLEKDMEGCFSIPDVIGEVTRPKKVKVTFLDRNGKRQKETLKGDLARIIQHEYDHVMGILFTDRIE
jgi:peptide deformylase